MNSRSHRGNSTFKDGQNKGTKGFIANLEKGNSVSIIIAFSKEKIYGRQVTMKTMNSDLIKVFYWNLYREINKDVKKNNIMPILIWDNCQIHKSKKVCEYIEETQARLCTISPYQPCLNPTEQLIGWIKWKIRS